jgi:hypothetical protein
MKSSNIRFHPLIPDHRIEALLKEYNSERDECPFYVANERHFCLLDYYSVHIEDCFGRCFSSGFCCELINSIFFNSNWDYAPEAASTSK